MVSANPSTMRETLVALLGAPYVEQRGIRLDFLPERRYALLAHLACRRAWVSRDALAFMFWPDQANAGARRNLRWVLHSARAIPGFDTVEAERIRFVVDTDVHRFEVAVRDQRWADAVSAYRGSLCAGFDAEAGDPFAQWLRVERMRLAELFHRSAMTLIGSVAPIEAASLARRLVADDPGDEEALCAGLRALRDLGQSREAKQLYREFSARMMDELGLEPGAATRALAHELDARLATRAPPPIEASFIGRRRELAEIATLLTQDCRLLTLMGPGGVGKSRLAREAAARFAAGPAWVVSLEALAVPDQFTGQVAAAMGVRLASRGSAEVQVAQRLGEQPCLLVLDNFEHLIDAADTLNRWLAACPELRCLITSRERLAIDGEWLLPVEGLETTSGASDDFLGSDAVQLFVERARAAKRAFDPSAERESIACIVAHVDGMPLAIELAAAWVRMIPCADIARDLQDGFELLEAVDEERGGPRSVRASFDHSWSLLMARERALFTRLSVFRRGFGREAVRQITDASLTAVAQLVDKSLVRADGDGRFSLHPLLRQFAAKQLANDPNEAAAARQRHAEFFAHWMARYSGIGQVDLAAALAALDDDIDNCLAAWEWAIDHQRADLVHAASLTLLAWFERRGRVLEGLACFTAADRLSPTVTGYAGATGNVERARATLALRAGRYDDAEHHARLALQRFKVVRDGAGIKSSLTTLGLANWERGRYAEARPYFAEGLKRCRADGDRSGEAGFLTNLALLTKAAGDYGATESTLQQAIEIFREIDERVKLISALNNLGNLYRALRMPERARQVLQDGLALSEQSGDTITLPFIVINLALVELEAGQLDAAERYALRALEIVRKGADRQIETGCHATLARVELARGVPASARMHLRTSARMAREMKHLPLLLGAAVNSAAALRLEGRPERAAAILHMVRMHPKAGQPDRDDVDRELAKLGPELPEAAIAMARAKAVELSLDDVITEAIDTLPVS